MSGGAGGVGAPVAAGSGAIGGSGGLGAVPASDGGATSAGMNAPGAGNAGSGGGGSLADAGAAGSAATGSDASAMHEDLGKGDGHDVVLLGDSYMSNTLQIEGTGGGIVPSLLQMTGQPYRNYAVQGTMLLMDDSYGRAIPTQWDDAKGANPDIKTVVMTGGGNDIIQNSSLSQACMTGGDACKQLLIQEKMRFDQVWSAMADAGVQDIIHVGYSTATGTVDAKLLNDPDVTSAPPICTSGKVRCHDLATTALIMGELAADNIHPLQAANDRIASALVDLMAKEGIRR
jgi:hypothetical protein